MISSSSGSHGGGEFYLAYLASGLVELRCEVTVLMSDGAHMEGLAKMISEICAVERMPLINTYHRKSRTIGSIFDRGQIRRVSDKILQLAPDVVHVNKQCVDDGLGVVQGAIRANLPMVTTIHVTRGMAELNAFGGRLRDWVAVNVLKQVSDPIVVVSNQCKQSWKELSGQSENVVVVPNGTRPADGRSKESVRQEWGAKQGDVFIGTIARIEEQKNPLFLVPIVAALPNNVHMFWIGDGSTREQLESEISKHEVEDRFHLLGWQDNAKSLLSGLDVFVLPSLYEGFPFAILEAMSASLPCVVSDVDGNGESVVHNETGFVLALNDADQWSAHLLKLANEEMLRDQMGRAGRIRFDQEYDVSVMAKRTLDVYQRSVSLRVGA